MATLWEDLRSDALWEWEWNTSLDNTTSYTLDTANGYAWTRISAPTATQAYPVERVTVDPDWRDLV
jgi:hypothetical protein